MTKNKLKLDIKLNKKGLRNQFKLRKITYLAKLLVVKLTIIKQCFFIHFYTFKTNALHPLKYSVHISL